MAPNKDGSAYLELDDGTIYHGIPFGATRNVPGEVGM